MPVVWQGPGEVLPASTGCKRMRLHYLHRLSLIYKNLCQAYRSPAARLEDLFHHLDAAGAPSFAGWVELAGVRWLNPMSITAFLPNSTSAPRLTTVEYTDQTRP